MSEHSQRNGPRTSEEFRDGLERLLQTATENNIEVEGGWAIEDDATGDLWDIHITSVERDHS